MAITIEEYAHSVSVLVHLALQDTSGSRAASQVLLSAYNGFEFQLNITDLGCLDEHYYEHALNVIRGRIECSCEPHFLIKNGSTVFCMLWDNWHGLHIGERHKVKCQTCDGYGKVYADAFSEDGKVCTTCNGTRRVCSCTYL